MIYHGDLFDVLPTLDANSIDASVTDPPYGIGFMGREWDTFKPAETEAEVKQQRRKVFRQEHGVEHDDAYQRNPNTRGRERSPAASPSQIEYDYSLTGLRGFQQWTARWSREVFRVLKPGAYLLSCGAPRSYHRMASGLEDAGFEIRDTFAWLFGQGFPKSVDVARMIDMELCKCPGRHCMRDLPPESKRKLTDHVCAETDAGKYWDGWGSALKPGHEPICVARKPFDGTLATNVLAYGTGGLNIDACRIEGDKPDTTRGAGGQNGRLSPIGAQGRIIDDGKGRWPANVLLDEGAAAMLDAQTGELAGGAFPAARHAPKTHDIYGLGFGDQCVDARRMDSGGASRFYYVAKPSREERSYGVRDRNTHPTVKPIALMRWLVRLVTAPDGIVLDPFLGSGTTGMACRYEQRKFIGIEREAEFVQIAENRISAVVPLFGEP